MVVTSARAWMIGMSASSRRWPSSAPNTLSAPKACDRRRNGNACTDRKPATAACGANRGQPSEHRCLVETFGHRTGRGLSARRAPRSMRFQRRRGPGSLPHRSSGQTGRGTRRERRPERLRPATETDDESPRATPLIRGLGHLNHRPPASARPSARRRPAPWPRPGHDLTGVAVDPIHQSGVRRDHPNPTKPRPTRHNRRHELGPTPHRLRPRATDHIRIPRRHNAMPRHNHRTVPHIRGHRHRTTHHALDQTQRRRLTISRRQRHHIGHRVDRLHIPPQPQQMQPPQQTRRIPEHRINLTHQLRVVTAHTRTTQQKPPTPIPLQKSPTSPKEQRHILHRIKPGRQRHHHRRHRNTQRPPHPPSRHHRHRTEPLQIHPVRNHMQQPGRNTRGPVRHPRRLRTTNTRHHPTSRHPSQKLSQRRPLSTRIRPMQTRDHRPARKINMIDQTKRLLLQGKDDVGRGRTPGRRRHLSPAETQRPRPTTATQRTDHHTRRPQLAVLSISTHPLQQSLPTHLPMNTQHRMNLTPTNMQTGHHVAVQRPRTTREEPLIHRQHPNTPNHRHPPIMPIMAE
jgi:hypothetical protein